ncbi:hypothetical protein GQ457_05G001390 [Hibiscus cannabinus]
MIVTGTEGEGLFKLQVDIVKRAVPKAYGGRSRNLIQIRFGLICYWNSLTRVIKCYQDLYESKKRNVFNPIHSLPRWVIVCIDVLGSTITILGLYWMCYKFLENYFF